jgi:LPS export ABC transporter protein LptC
VDIQHPGRLAFLVAGALATSVVFLINQPGEKEEVFAPRLGIGYYLKGARLSGSGIDGQILYRVTADAAEQDLADGSIAMRGVAMNYAPPDEVPWALRADRGHIPPDRNIIQLSGDVVVTAAAPGGPPLSIRTDYLELDPDTYIARTDSGVSVERSRNTLRARGMRVYLKQDRLQLENEVRGRFLP